MKGLTARGTVQINKPVKHGKYGGGVVEVPGANPGDAAFASPLSPAAGCTFTAWVASPGVVHLQVIRAADRPEENDRIGDVVRFAVAVLVVPLEGQG